MNIPKQNNFFIQNVLIRYFLAPLAKLTDRIPKKTKDTVFIISGVLIVLLQFLCGSNLVDVRYLVYYCAGCILLGIMILCTLNTTIQPIKFRPFLIICWLAIGATISYSGIFNSVEFLPEGILFLIAYPIIFIVWNNNNTDEIFKKLVTIIDISFIIYLIVSMLLFPMHSLRYSGLYSNLNGAAGYLAIVFACLLIEVVKEKKLSFGFFFHIILLGLSIASLMYTNSRTGQLALLITFVIFAVVFFFSHLKEKKTYILRNIFLILVSATMFFYITLHIFQVGNYLPLPKLNKDTWTNEEISVGSSLQLTEDRLISDETLPNTSTINTYSSGRIAIWTEYAKLLNFEGHSDSGEVSFIYGDTTRYYRTAHMTILQFAYENGILSGLFYLIFNLVAGFYSIKYAFRHKNEAYACFPLIISVAYGVHSMLATTTVSFWYLSALYYYLVQFPIMKKD